MNTKLHLIMPMAGKGSRFSKQGFEYPKPLIRIYGKPFFFWATQSIAKFVDLESLDFVVLQEHIEKFRIDDEIRKYYPKARIHALSKVTEGAVITSLNGLDDISDDLPIVFNDCDHLFKCSTFNDFCVSCWTPEINGLLLTFKSEEPKYSFVGKDEKGNIIRTVEKEVISNEAICGCYYFSNVSFFKKSAEEYLKKCNYSEYFMSGVYNILIENGFCIKSMLTDYHVSFGVPEEYDLAQNCCEYKELQ